MHYRSHRKSKFTKFTNSTLAGLVMWLGGAAVTQARPPEHRAMQTAKANSDLAAPAFTQVHKWLHEKMLPAIESCDESS